MPKKNDLRLPILEIKDGQIYLDGRLIPCVLKYNLNVEDGRIPTIDIKVAVETIVNPSIPNNAENFEVKISNFPDKEKLADEIGERIYKKINEARKDIGRRN